MKKINNSTVRVVCFILAVLVVVGMCSFLLGIDKKETYTSTPLNPPQIGSNLGSDNGYISFLGDSITTFDGWSNSDKYNSTISDNGFYYTSSKMSVTDTWWYQVADELGLGLCCNNSWDGARVSNTKVNIPDGKTRAKEMHNDIFNVMPNVIVVYLGTNDLANGVSLDVFSAAYAEMLSAIKTNYAAATVYCCTILPESRNADKQNELISFNQAICELSEEYGCDVIDFYENITDWDYLKDTFVDGSMRVHPNANGMDKLSNCAIDKMKG